MTRPRRSSGPLLPPPSWLEAVVFDLGGTLIDYLGGAPSWPAMEIPGVRALYAHLTGAGLRFEAEHFHDRFIRVMDDRWREATAGHGAPPTIRGLILEVCEVAEFVVDEDLYEAAAAAYYAPIAARAVAAPGARETLAWLSDHGVRLGLISNTLWPGDAHRADLDRYGLLPYLDKLVFSSGCGLWKPDPRIFALVLGNLGVEAERAVFVGDRLIEDVQGAKRAGLRAVFVDDGSQDPESGVPQPDAIVRSLTELPAVLAALT